MFSGAGGLTLGFAEAARRSGIGINIRLAVDVSTAAMDTFSANFPEANAWRTTVESVFSEEFGASPSEREIEARNLAGEVHLLLGGPPCQGMSSLNNKTRHLDERNRLYDRMARAAEIMRPYAVLIENVPSARRDQTKVVDRTVRALDDQGYSTCVKVVDMAKLGVPQRRSRLIVLATRPPLLPAEEIWAVVAGCGHTRTTKWALSGMTIAGDTDLRDQPTNLSKKSRKRIDWLFANEKYDLPNALRPSCHQGNHSYVSMYGRLKWDEPAQTITSGYGSMGQGRFVHPGETRTLTPHEAARLQTFPDFYRMGVKSRGELAELIGNAVPPVGNIAIGTALLMGGLQKVAILAGSVAA